MPSDMTFTTWDDLGSIISHERDKSSSTFVILYLNIVNSRSYVESVPEEHQAEQRENAVDYVRCNLMKQLTKDELESDGYVVGLKRTHRPGYDKLVLGLSSDIEDMTDLEERLETTVNNILENIHGREVPLADGLQHHTGEYDLRKIVVKAGVVYSIADEVHVSKMLTRVRQIRQDAKEEVKGYIIEKYTPEPSVAPQDATNTTPQD